MMSGTGEGHVEQVEIVDGVLQVFLMVVVLVDGARHLLLVVVDRHDGQGIERLFLRLTPEDITR